MKNYTKKGSAGWLRAMALFFLTASVFGPSFCHPDEMNLSKEKSFGVSNHQKRLNDFINVFDGFTFHRYPNAVTKQIDSSGTISFNYTASYKKVDFATMKETVIASKPYSGSIASGANESFIALKALMADLGVKDYTGYVVIEVTDAKGANCAGTGDSISLQLVKTAMDAAAK